MGDLINKIEKLVKRAGKNQKPLIKKTELHELVVAICRNIRIKAPIRFLLSCAIAKIDKPDIDIRKPYTEIKSDDSYSGRTYDEQYIQIIIDKFRLPCNSTTAYLTPAFRNRNSTMTTKTQLVGRQPKLYHSVLVLLDAVYINKLSPEELFQDIIRELLIIRDENENRLKQLIKGLKGSKESKPLSSEQIVTLLQQHLACKNSSRLPVLIVASAYNSVAEKISESIKPLQAHNAADKQTGAFGDVEIILENEDKIVTSYEMKAKLVTKSDIEIAINKIAESKLSIDNYIFITTDRIDIEVEDYAKSLYEEIGVEIAILECIGFIRHFLHFFHRKRTDFLDIYQQMILEEQNSAVSQPLKEAFLALRQSAEAENC